MSFCVAASFDVLLVGDKSFFRSNEPVAVRRVDLHESMGLKGGMLKDARRGCQHSLSQLLELVWKYGQNDFQEREVRSLMVGDIIVLPFDPFYVEVKPNGFLCATLVGC